MDLCPAAGSATSLGPRLIVREFPPFGTHRQRYSRRLVTVGIFAALLGAGLAVRLAWLQVAQAPRYAALARGNRIRVMPLAPTRGLIYDRNGTVLAENVPTYELSLIPDQVGNVATTLKRLGHILTLTPENLEDFRRLRAAKPPFQSIPVKTDLTPREVARFAVNRQKFPGVDVHAALKRYYPAGTDAAAVVGYVGLISAADLRRLDPSQYSASSHVGKTGVEREYEQILHGQVGYQKVEVNAAGRVVRKLSVTPPHPGANLYLTIDDRLQRTASDALGDQRGAVVAVNPQNGAILCLVSKPSFNPNLFVNGISTSAYHALLHGSGQPLVDRALRGRYAPGSTIKPFLGLAGLYYGVLTPTSTIYAGPTFTLPNYSHVFHNWDPYQNGPQTLEQAIIHSTDTFFYQLAERLGIGHMHAFLARFGFGKVPPVDLPGALAGVNPSPAWKERVLGKPWYLGQTIIDGIGQGYLQVTPMQLAWATATLAAHGRRYQPHVLQAISDGATGKPEDVPPDPLGSITLPEPADWNYISNAMREVITNPAGTAHGIDKGLNYPMAGKTGTAQVTSIYHSDFAKERNIPLAERDNALFIAFAPIKHPTIAVAVVVEHGGGGASAAAPIARRVIDAWMHGDDNPENARRPK